MTNETALLIEDALYYQKYAKAFAHDAMYHAEHGSIGAARHAQENARTYSLSAIATVAALLERSR